MEAVNSLQIWFIADRRGGGILSGESSGVKLSGNFLLWEGGGVKGLEMSHKKFFLANLKLKSETFLKAAIQPLPNPFDIE